MKNMTDLCGVAKETAYAIRSPAFLLNFFATPAFFRS